MQLFIYFLLTTPIISLFAQSQEELIRSGIKLYNTGKYIEAEKYFNKAIKSYSLTDKDSYYAETSYDNNILSRNEAYNESPETYFADLSEIEYSNVEERNLVEIEIKRYMDEPLKYSGKDLADIYFFKGKTNLYLRRYPQALSDFSKVLKLNPSYTEAYLTRSIVKHIQGAGKVCADLEKATKLGDSSAKIIHEHLCN